MDGWIGAERRRRRNNYYSLGATQQKPTLHFSPEPASRPVLQCTHKRVSASRAKTGSYERPVHSGTQSMLIQRTDESNKEAPII